MFVMISGITNEEDALLAVALGADAVAFDFSPTDRQINPARAAQVVKRLPAEIYAVGTFRDESPARVVQVANHVGLRGVKLDGHERSDDTVWIKQRVPIVIKSFDAGSRHLEKLSTFAIDIVCLRKDQTSGIFDWSWTDHLDETPAVMLSGGLTPDNVAYAVDQTKAWGVEANSGVEKRVGRKDPRLLHSFIKNAKETEQEELGFEPVETYE